MHKSKFRNRYTSLPLPVKATIWFTTCQFLQKGISILTTPFIARMLSTVEYGRASTFASWENIFLILVTLSSGHAIMNLCVKCKNRKAMLSSLMGYNLVISSLWGVLLFSTINIISNATGFSHVMIVCLYLFCVFHSLISCWLGLKQYEYSYKKAVVETLIYTMGSSFGALFAIAFISKTAEAKIMPQVISAFIIGLVVTISVFRSGKVFYSREVWKFAFCFCVPLLPHFLSEIVLMSSDRLMIDRMCGSSDVAVYSIAYAVGSLISMATSAINWAFAPYQYQKITSKEYKILAQNTNYIIAFIAFCLCGVMLFGREVVLIFGGRKYVDSISLIAPISLGAFFNYIFQLFARVQEYFEQKHTIVIASVCCAVLNIILNYIFIRIYGYKAAAYTTFVCYFVFCFLHYLFYRKVCKKFVAQEIYDIRGLAFISTVLIVATLIINLISGLYILKYIILVFAVIITICQKKRILGFIKTLREKG